jgi:hypothetical protein
LVFGVQSRASETFVRAMPSFAAAGARLDSASAAPGRERGDAGAEAEDDQRAAGEVGRAYAPVRR